MNMSKAAATALAAPGCVLAMATGIGLVMTVFGQSPMWPHQSVNLAEAAGVYDEAAMVRLIEDGMNPDVRYPVRPGLIFGYAMTLTPLEAAVANDDPTMVTRLIEKGANAGRSGVDAPALHRRRREGSLLARRVATR